MEEEAYALRVGVPSGAARIQMAHHRHFIAVGKTGQLAQTIQTRWGNRSLLTTPKPFRSKKRT